MICLALAIIHQFKEMICLALAIIHQFKEIKN